MISSDRSRFCSTKATIVTNSINSTNIVQILQILKQWPESVEIKRQIPKVLILSFRHRWAKRWWSDIVWTTRYSDAISVHTKTTIAWLLSLARRQPSDGKSPSKSPLCVESLKCSEHLEYKIGVCVTLYQLKSYRCTHFLEVLYDLKCIHLYWVNTVLPQLVSVE